jgi:hypothetical protein
LSGLLVREEEISLMTWVRLIGQVGSKDACMRLSLVSAQLSLVCTRLSLDLIALCLHRLVSGVGLVFRLWGCFLNVQRFVSRPKPRLSRSLVCE